MRGAMRGARTSPKGIGNNSQKGLVTWGPFMCRAGPSSGPHAAGSRVWNWTEPPLVARKLMGILGQGARAQFGNPKEVPCFHTSEQSWSHLPS